MSDKALTYEEKIAYLSGETDKIKFSDGKYEKIVFADDLLTDDEYFFDYGLLADSWDKDLAKEVAAMIASRAKEEGATAMVLPPLAPVTTPVAVGASEDDTHICALAAAAAEGVSSVGITPVISGFGVKKSMLTGNAAYDEKAVADAFVKPLEKFKSGNTFPAVAYDVADESFKIPDLIKSAIGVPECEFCVRASGRDSVKEIKKGRKVLRGDGDFALNAYEDCKKYESRLLKGQISDSEIHALNERNEIIDEKAIDEAFNLCERYADRENVGLPLVSSATAKDVLKRLARESVVLLKNDDGVLPLSARTKVAVVGNCEAKEFASALSSADINAEFFDGYSAKSDEIFLDENEKNKISACEDIIFFIDNERRKNSASALPANRIAALDALKSLNKKIIVVAIGNRPLNMNFDDYCDGLLIVRGNCKYLGDALQEILYGEVNPTGRLAVSLFDDAEEYYESVKRDEVLTDTHSGTFFGYRYYDSSSAKKVKYPFGFGLSYGKCAYRVLSTDCDKTTISVFNETNETIDEVFQVYVGSKNKTSPHPQKELAAFGRVTVKPRASFTVRIDIGKNAFAFYSPYKSRFVVEKGAYNVYVGVSSAEATVANVEITGAEPVKTEITETEVFPRTSNVVSGGYSMEEGENLMKNSKKLSLTAWILLIATVLTDVAVAVLWIANELQFDLYEPWFILLVSALVLNHIIFVVALCILINVKKRNREVEKLLKTVREEKFADATVLKNDSARDIFKVVEAPVVKDEEVVVTEEKGYAAYDKTIKFSAVCDSLRDYLSASGYSVAINEVRAIVASFASSRFIIAGGRNRRAEILDATAKFLLANSFLINLKSDESDDMLKSEDFNLAVDCAKKSRDEMVFCMFTGVSAKKCNSAFMKLLPYFAFPESGKTIHYSDGVEEKKIILPPNMWFVVILSDSLTGTLSKETLADAQTLFVEAEEKDVGEAVVPTKAMGYNQFVTMAAVAKEKICADEESWKRVDSIEKAFAEYSFKADNKEWQIMETFSSVFLSAGGEENQMTDYLISERIIPSVFGYAEDLQSNGKSLKDVIETACGEDYSTKIEYALKELTAAAEEADIAAEAQKREQAAQIDGETEAEPQEVAATETDSEAEPQEVVATETDSESRSAQETNADGEADKAVSEELK